MVVHNVLSNEEFTSKVLAKSNTLKVVDFFATWCGPCKTLAPILVEHSDTHKDVEFYKVDVDQLSELSADIGITAMPTILFYKGGEEVHKIVGANPGAIESGIKSNKA